VISKAISRTSSLNHPQRYCVGKLTLLFMPFHAVIPPLLTG